MRTSLLNTFCRRNNFYYTKLSTRRFSISIPFSFCLNSRKMIGLFLLCCHGDWVLACTICVYAFKKLSVFQITKVLPKHFSFSMSFHTECKKIGKLLCDFFKLPFTCNPLSHVVQLFLLLSPDVLSDVYNQTNN